MWDMGLFPEDVPMSADSRKSLKLDEALDKTFPASDPVAISEGTGTEPPTSSIDRKTPVLHAEQPESHHLQSKEPEQYGPGTGEPLRFENKVALVAIAAFAGSVLMALSFMLGNNGTQNDGNTRGPSATAQNRADPPPSQDGTPPAR
jgi:hypothetical protein